MNNRRQLFTKYYFGNAMFWILCATFGFVSYSFLSFSFQFIYEVFDRNAAYHLFSSGLVLLVMGTTFLVLKKIKPDLGFRSLIFTIFLTLLLMYWGGFFANAYPKISIYIFIPVYFLISSLLLLFITSWKRSGGVPMVTSFLVGVLVSGLFSYLYGVDFSFLAIAVRISAVLFLMFTIVYLIGWFGIFKKRLFYVGALSLILMLSVLYPFDTENAVEQFKRYKWETKKNVVGPDYEYIGSYRTTSRDIDVFVKDSSDKEEMRFVENGALSPFAYPVQDKYKFSFYVLLAQNKEHKKILSVGDIPSGMVNIFDNFSKLQNIDYFPIDPNYPDFWANFIHDDMFQNIRIWQYYSDLKRDYDLVLLFPPHIKGIGAAPYISLEQFKKLKKLMNPSGTFVVVAPSDFGILSTVSNENLTKLFKQVKTVALTSGLSFIGASDDPGSISSDPSTIKYRLLDAGIKKDYAETKKALDSDGFFEKRNASKQAKEIVKEKVIPQYLFLCTLFVLIIMAMLYQKIESSRKFLSYTGGALIFMTLGSVFGLYTLSHQRLFVDLNVLFPLILSVFLFACGVGLLLGLWMRLKFNMFSLFFTGALLFLVPALYKCFFASTDIGKNDTMIMSIILGISSLFIFGTKLWSELNINVSNMVQLLGTTLVGLGAGFMVAALFDYNMFNVVREEYYLLFTAVCIIGLFVMQIKFRGEIT